LKKHERKKFGYDEREKKARPALTRKGCISCLLTPKKRTRAHLPYRKKKK